MIISVAMKRKSSANSLVLETDCMVKNLTGKHEGSLGADGMNL